MIVPECLDRILASILDPSTVYDDHTMLVPLPTRLQMMELDSASRDQVLLPSAGSDLLYFPHIDPAEVAARRFWQAYQDAGMAGQTLHIHGQTPSLTTTGWTA
jgi:hypothetical protein